MIRTSHLRNSVAITALLASVAPLDAQTLVFATNRQNELFRVQANAALAYADRLLIAHDILKEDLRIGRTPGLAEHLATNDRPPASYTGVDQRLFTDFRLRARFCDGALLTYIDEAEFAAGVTSEQVQVAHTHHRRISKINDITRAVTLGSINGDVFQRRHLGNTPIADCLVTDYATPLPQGRPALLDTIQPLNEDVYDFEAKTFSHTPCPDGTVGGGVLRSVSATFGRTSTGRISQITPDEAQVEQSFCRAPVTGTREIVFPCTLTIASKDIPSSFVISAPYAEIADPNDPLGTIIEYDNTGPIIRSSCSAFPPDAPTVNTSGNVEVIATPLACPVDFPEGERVGEHTVTTTTTSFTTGQPDIVNVFTSDLTETVNECHRLEVRARNTAARNQCTAPFNGGFFDTLTTTEETFQVFADGRDDVLVDNSAQVVNQHVTLNRCYTNEVVFEEDPVVYTCGGGQHGQINAVYTQRVVIRNFLDPVHDDVEVDRRDESVRIISNSCHCPTDTEQQTFNCSSTIANTVAVGDTFTGENPGPDGMGIDAPGAQASAGTGTSTDSSDSDGGDGGDGACVIYSELAAQQRMSKSDQMLNWYWTHKRYRNPDHMIRGYQIWAKPVVRAMRRSSSLSCVADHLAHARLREIEYQLGRRQWPSLAGKIVRLSTEPLSWALGFFAPPLVGEGRKAPRTQIKETFHA